jgi:hypothetical protein
MGGCQTERDQGCKDGQTAPSWNVPALLVCKQLYVGMQCHGGTPYWMSAFHSFCSEWPYAVFFSGLQYKTWLNSKVADFFDKGTQKLIP